MSGYTLTAFKVRNGGGDLEKSRRKRLDESTTGAMRPAEEANGVIIMAYSKRDGTSVGLH
jgi:hypothetical protein